MYIHLCGYEPLRPHPSFRHSRDRLLHAFPARVAKFLPQSPFRPLPARLGLCHLSLACPREMEQALPPVLSVPHANPALPPQQPQRPRQSRTIHGKAGAQPLLISLSHRGQRGQQTELRDLKTCPSQFLVVNPRYDPAEAAKVLTRAWQLKECIRRLLSKSLPVHIICIYICYACVSNKIFAWSLNLKFTLEGTQMTRGGPKSLPGRPGLREKTLWKNEPEYWANRRLPFPDHRPVRGWVRSRCDH